jgi:transposase
MRIAIETGTHSPWVSRLLEECGHEVLVANSRKLRLIYANRRKTDEVDALRTWPAWREWIRSWFVPCRAPRRREPGSYGLNPLPAGVGRLPHAACKTRPQDAQILRGPALPKCPARSFHKRAKEHIPGPLLPALGAILEQR